MSNLHRVIWCKSVSAMSQLHGDYGTTVHITESNAASGKTLCGREYPRDKGYPSVNRVCKICKRKAGLDDIRVLPWVKE